MPEGESNNVKLCKMDANIVLTYCLTVLKLMQSIAGVLLKVISQVMLSVFLISDMFTSNFFQVTSQVFVFESKSSL